MALPDRRVNWLFIQTAYRKLDNRLDLVAVKSVKPFHDVVDIRPSFQILEDGRYRHPRALQNPSAAHLAGDALHDWALRPIETRHCSISFS
jgi:hypothetical protein